MCHWTAPSIPPHVKRRAITFLIRRKLFLFFIHRKFNFYKRLNSKKTSLPSDRAVPIVIHALTLVFFLSNPHRSLHPDGHHIFVFRSSGKLVIRAHIDINVRIAILAHCAVQTPETTVTCCALRQKSHIAYKSHLDWDHSFHSSVSANRAGARNSLN